MQEIPVTHRKLVLVCTNCRDDGRECCAEKGSVDLHRKLKEAVKAVDPTVRVSKSGCLDRCSTGATVVIMPDNRWFGGVTDENIPEILTYIV